MCQESISTRVHGPVQSGDFDVIEAAVCGGEEMIVAFSRRGSRTPVGALCLHR
jgi:hypothetical protein